MSSLIFLRNTNMPAVRMLYNVNRLLSITISITHVYVKLVWIHEYHYRNVSSNHNTLLEQLFLFPLLKDWQHSKYPDFYSARSLVTFCLKKAIEGDLIRFSVTYRQNGFLNQDFWFFLTALSSEKRSVVSFLGQ